MNDIFTKINKKTAFTYLGVIVAYVLMQCLSGSLSYSVKGQLVPICVYIVLALSLNLVVGISGELSLGHAGFMGIGAFTGVTVATICQTSVENAILRLIIAMVIGGTVAGVFGFIIGIPVMRLNGDYLAIVTLAFGEILKNIIGNIYVGYDSNGLHFAIENGKLQLQENGKMIINGAMGATGVKSISTFTVGFVLILFTLFVIFNIVNSKEGRAIKAIRDNKIAAESVGINVTAFRVKAFVVAAALAGMAGALYGLNMNSVDTSKFGFNTSINILVYVVLGGMGNIPGTIIATIVLYMLPEAMRGLEDYRMIIYSVVLIFVMLFTWSPKFKGIKEAFKTKIGKLFKKARKA